MKSLDHLRAFAAILENAASPQLAELQQFIDDCDADRLDPANPEDLHRIRKIHGLCRHSRGYQEFYYGVDQPEIGRILWAAGDEIHALFPSVDFD